MTKERSDSHHVLENKFSLQNESLNGRIDQIYSLNFQRFNGDSIKFAVIFSENTFLSLTSCHIYWR